MENVSLNIKCVVLSPCKGQYGLSPGHFVLGLPVKMKDRRYFCIVMAIVELTELDSPPPAPVVPLGPLSVLSLEEVALELVEPVDPVGAPVVEFVEPVAPPLLVPADVSELDERV